MVVSFDDGEVRSRASPQLRCWVLVIVDGGGACMVQ